MIRTSRRSEDYARGVERLLADGSAVGLSEAQLVERFATGRDESAFAALVDRHGPMVLGVCRRLLRDPNDADDAFQAVFLVLARKAGGLRRKELVGNWLYGVAGRVASEARRRPRPAIAADPSAFDVDARRPAPPEPSDAAARDEDGRRLHEEVGRLPARYRAPVVACYFEGRTHEEAAALLDCPVGTVKGRLARARDLLRARLERRGVTAPAALLATALAAPDLRAAVPPALASRAVAGALAVVASPSAWMTAALSTSVRSLSEGAIQAMFYSHLKSLAIPATLAAGLLAAGAGLASAGREGPQAPGEAPAVPAADDAAARPQPAEAPSPDPADPRQEFVRASLDLGPVEVLELIDRTGEAVVRRSKESEVDLSGVAEHAETLAILDRFCDEIDELVGRLRAAKAADPKGRALLDAFAESLGRLLLVRGGKGGPGGGPTDDAEALDDAYFVFKRSVERARLEASKGTEARDAARARYEIILAQILSSLREPRQEGVTRALLAAYADYLEAIDPFVEEPGFRRMSAGASGPQAPPADRSVEAVLKDVWKVVDQYQKSYQAAIQSHQPGKPDQMEEAMARHYDRVGRLEMEVRTRVGTDLLLQSLADYLIVASKPQTEQPGQNIGPMMTFSMINLVRSNLQGALKRARAGMGPEPDDFDRELAREVLARAREGLLAESYRQAERDPVARDLLTRHADYVAKLSSIDSYVFPPPAKPAVARVEGPAPAPAAGPIAEDPKPEAGMAPGIILDVTWRIAEQYRKSHAKATEFPAGKPINDAKAAEAMARHVQRIGQMAEDLSRRSSGDLLLKSLADFLEADFQASLKPPTHQPARTDSGTIQTLSLILTARDDLKRARMEEPSWNPDMNEFDRSLIHESVSQAMEDTFDDLDKQANSDERSRDLLARYAEVLKQYMSSDAFLFPERRAIAPPPFLIRASNPDQAAAPEPKPAAPQTSVTEPAIAPFGGGGGFSGPSPEEVRQKVAGLAATMASVDKDPNNRKVYDVLDRPVALKSAEDGTLGKLIERVKSNLKAEDGSTVPLYVDPKGLEAADASLDSPVSIDLDEVPLKFALRLALKQLGLASCVRDGVLIISSLEGVEQELLEAQRELMGVHPERFILDPNGSIRPAAGMAQPGGMM